MGIKHILLIMKPELHLDSNRDVKSKFGATMLSEWYLIMEKPKWF